MTPLLFPQLSTERLSFRRPKESDWQEVCYLRSNKEVNQFVQRQACETKEKAIEFITSINQKIDKGTILYWVITKHNSDQMIGSICLWKFSEDGKTAEVGYDLHPNSQRKGIMDESLKEIIKLGFGTLKLHTIEAYTHRKNASSTQLLIRNGFGLRADLKDDDNPNNAIYLLSK